jgi:predicted TIM-barrel fold metal-dependent hydrolase
VRSRAGGQHDDRQRSEIARQAIADGLGPRVRVERVMAASNWPVILLGASYEKAWRGIAALVAINKDPRP